MLQFGCLYYKISDWHIDSFSKSKDFSQTNPWFYWHVTQIHVKTEVGESILVFSPSRRGLNGTAACILTSRSGHISFTLPRHKICGLRVPVSKGQVMSPFHNYSCGCWRYEIISYLWENSGRSKALIYNNWLKRCALIYMLLVSQWVMKNNLAM